MTDTDSKLLEELIIRIQMSMGFAKEAPGGFSTNLYDSALTQTDVEKALAIHFPQYKITLLYENNVGKLTLTKTTTK